ncbi:MAG: tetratricopeptide repeat protein [Armatimonadota bacterium]
MAGRRWLAIIAIILLIAVAPVFADENEESSEPTPPAAPVITEEIARMLERGRMLMGQNNTDYAPIPIKIPFEERNRAGREALHVFEEVVEREPKLAQGWLWLGIAYTQQLQYTKSIPQGKPYRPEAYVNEGIEAFQKAHLCDPASEDGVKYYGDALMEFRKDFDAALKLWQDYLLVAKTDLQRMVANVQAARACLNKANFGKEAKLPPEQVQKYYQDAVVYVNNAVELCPNARDVKEMQALLGEYKYLAGK